MKRVAFVVAAVLFAIGGATVLTNLSGSTASDNAFAATAPADHPVVIESGDGWTVERGDTCNGWRIRVGDRTTRCWDGPLQHGDTMAGFQQGAGHHFVFFVYDAAQAPRARYFSSAGGLGTEVSLQSLSGDQWLGVVDLGRTTAYGVQFLAQDGTLLTSMSLG